MNKPAKPSSAPLSLGLRNAAHCLQAVGAGRSLTEALAAVPLPQRPQAQALAFHALRQWGAAKARRTALTKPSTAADLAALLDVAISLLGPADDAQAPRYDAHTVVNQAVEAAKADKALRHTAPVVNAVLRRVLREQANQAGYEQAFGPDTPGRAPHDAAGNKALEARWNHPAWWVKRLQADWPREAEGLAATALWQAILAANQQPAPLILRVNRVQGSREAYAQRLAEAGIAVAPPQVDDPEQALTLLEAVAVHSLPGFEVGACSVQDAHAQLAAPLLLAGLPAPADGQPLRVLDACAAPGGKTAHLLECLAASERTQAEVWALDKDAERLLRVQRNLLRLGFRFIQSEDKKDFLIHLEQEKSSNQAVCRLLAADAGQPSGWWNGELFDGVLLDAPCTASGIVRRHPDVRWLRRASDVDQLAAEQRRLLDALWPLVKPGGRLLYCTCSVFQAEGQDQADAFVSRHKDARTEPAPGHLLPGSVNNRSENTTSPSKIQGDGFFYALFTKT